MTPYPLLPAILFIITTLLTLYLFSRAWGHSVKILFLLALWLALQGAVALTGFYTVTDAVPPRFLLLVLPPLFLILFCLFSRMGRKYMDHLDMSMLTILHVVRLPVELVLFGLYINDAIPELMTFEGRNPDIIAGISAPLIYYFGYVRKSLHRSVILLWNAVCLGLLFNIVILAIFSAPFPFQKLAFDQPNIGVLYFPFVWLPCLIVPAVLFAHVTLLRNLLLKPSRQVSEDDTLTALKKRL